MSIESYDYDCVDLFCGCGGFSCGFLDPCIHFIGIDKDPVALDTYRINIGSDVIEVDVTEIMPEELVARINMLRVGKKSILIGSPPCQPHSYANKHASHDATLIEYYLKVRDLLQPEFWAMEEVPAVAKYNLIEKGFIHFYKACDFGMPHRRERFYAGNFPAPKKHPFKHKRVQTPTTTGYNHFVYTNKPEWPALHELRMMLKTPIAQMRGYYHGKDDKNRIIKQLLQISPTPDARGYAHDLDRLGKDRHVRPSTQELVQYKDLITPAFCAAIMGFPEWFVFSGNKSAQYRQIGNAVCPPIARAIWTAIKTVKMRLF